MNEKIALIKNKLADTLIKVAKRLKQERRDYEEVVFELSGPEGVDFKDLKVSEVAFDGKHRSHYISTPTKIDTIFLYVKVVGFRDLRAPIGNWGVSIRNKDDLKNQLERVDSNFGIVRRLKKLEMGKRPNWDFWRKDGAKQ